MVSPEFMMDNSNAPWYFLSALAQCAAAFAALVAVFATFRLQSNLGLIEDVVNEGKTLLFKNRGRDAIADQEDVLEYLRKVCRGEEDSANRDRACRLLKQIEHHKDFPGFLANELGTPLKLWTMVFIGSVSPLSFTQLPARIVLFVIGPTLAFLTSLAILSSNTFIQACLQRAAGKEQPSGDLIQKGAGWLARKVTNTGLLYFLAAALIVVLTIKTWRDWEYSNPEKPKLGSFGGIPVTQTNFR